MHADVRGERGVVRRRRGEHAQAVEIRYPWAVIRCGAGSADKEDPDAVVFQSATAAAEGTADEPCHPGGKFTSDLEDWKEGTGQMERLDSKFYQKYTALKKRKLLDEGLQSKREAEFKLLYDALKDWITELKKDNDELNKKLVDKEDELEKARQECSARLFIDSGNGTDEIPSARYSFTLTWLEEHGEWSYKLSSLGTLERIAVDWMRQDIRFSPKMCHMFFERISSIITRGGQHAL